MSKRPSRNRRHRGRTAAFPQIDTAGECQEDDIAIVVDGTTYPIEDLKIHHDETTATPDEPLNVTYSGSLTIDFEDEEEAEKFWEKFFK